MAAGPVFSVQSASKTFGPRKALDGVSVSVAPGEMVALIGPSGSGKSTLLRSLIGLNVVDRGGTVSVFGDVIQRDGRLTGAVQRVRSRVGFIFQQFNLVRRLSLFSNVAVGALGRVGFWRGLLGLWPRTDKQRVMAALQRVGVADYAGQRAGTLSGGQQQRGAIARALVQGAEAILADEPVASLDPVSSRRVMELLRDLNAEDGVTVVVTLHHVDLALKYCRRVIALQAGRIVYDGPVEGLTRERLIEIYGPEYDPVDGQVAVPEEPPARPTKDEKPWVRWLQAAVFAGLIVTAGAALLLDRDEAADINFSILSTENSQNVRSLWDPLLNDMERATGLEVEPFFGSNYNALVNAMRFNQTQVGWFSNKSGLEAVRQGGGEVFLSSSDVEGVDGYNSILIVNAASDLTLDRVMACDKSLDFGIGDANSTSGTLAPVTYLFAPAGVQPEQCFRTVRASNHEANLRAVATGQIPVATNNSTNLEVMQRRDPATRAKVKVIWTSPRIPEDPIVWRKDLDPEKKRKVREFFLTYGNRGGPDQRERERAILAELSFGVFKPADDTHLLPVREMEATERLLLAQNARDAAAIAAAETELDRIRAERAALAARMAAPGATPATVPADAAGAGR
jgi:phosphonate transport system substrate-binding protein